MLQSQKITVRMSEIRTKLREIAQAENLTEEQRAAEPKLTAELTDCETQYRAAVQTEAEQLGTDPEGREIAGIESRARLGTYLSRIAADPPLDGAEKELQEAGGMGGDVIPLAAIAPHETRQQERQTEHRAVTPGPASTPAGSTFVDRVFKDSGAAYLGAMMPSVPAGAAVYNLVSAGPDAEAKAKDAADDATAGSFTSTALKPTRIPARYTFRQEEMAEDPGLEPALRRDLSGLLSEALDERVTPGPGPSVPSLRVSP